MSQPAPPGDPERPPIAPSPRPRPAPGPRVEEAGDARLVERSREGDDDAFAALVGRYERKLIRVLLRLVHDEELARDLAQETFWKVYNRLDRFDTARRFGPDLTKVWILVVGRIQAEERPVLESRFIRKCE